MPICPRCQNGYENTEPHCPQCGAPRPVFLTPPRRVLVGPRRKSYSRSVFIWLQIGRLLTLIFVIIACISGLIDVVQLSWRGVFKSLITLLLGIPLLIAQYIAFGLAIDYAEERNLENQKEEQD